VELILNDNHLSGALAEAFSRCRHRLFIATADVKDLHVPGDGDSRDDRSTRTRRKPAKSILEIFFELAERGVEIRLLHGGVPSEPFIERIKELGLPTTMAMRRCPRMHAKAVIVDGRWMYLGSANLTGAGLGAKSERRRNFEAGICTENISLIDGAADMLEDVWSGRHCTNCGRKKQCPVPLEEPHL
jgi:phosphatidylserine/phosphatidylglycerophosphate/cardiolipin synthase-like enzyme